MKILKPILFSFSFSFFLPILLSILISILITPTHSHTLAIDQVRSTYNVFVSESFTGYSSGFGMASVDYEFLLNLWNISPTFHLFAHIKAHYTRFNSQNKILTSAASRFANSFGATLQIALLPNLFHAFVGLSPGVHLNLTQAVETNMENMESTPASKSPQESNSFS